MSGRDFPVVVAGGGPAGAAAALVLAREDRRVLLVDAANPGAQRVGEALPPAARPLLRDLGVLDRFLADGHLPCHGNLSAWGSEEPRAHDHLMDPHGHAWHLDRGRFDALLREAARDAGAEVRTGATIREAERENGGWRIRLHGAAGEPREVRAEWVLDATGRRSAIARRHGGTRLRSDRLVAFHARFRPSGASGEDGDGRTVIEAVPDGWWYTALLPSRERMAAYFTDADLADRAAMLTPAGYAAALRHSTLVRAILARSGHAIHDRPRGADAGSARLDHFAGPGWLAAGDAALSFDPLSSQGMLNALYTGLRAGEALVRALDGDSAGIAAYASRLEDIHAAYDRNRSAYYAAERRWSGRPFWQRRKAGPEAR
jgi:flavin-dependent dehydrogenase